MLRVDPDAGSAHQSLAGEDQRQGVAFPCRNGALLQHPLERSRRTTRCDGDAFAAGAQPDAIAAGGDVCGANPVAFAALEAQRSVRQRQRRLPGPREIERCGNGRVQACPAAMNADRGALVTLKGSCFTGATTVDFNGSSASFTVQSDTQISATVPNGATNGAITVYTPNGVSSKGTFKVTGP